MPKEQNYQKSMRKHVRTQQLRKAKKKARPNQKSRPPRRKDWDNLAQMDDWDDRDIEYEERIMPVGTQEQRKEVEQIVKKGLPDSKETAAETKEPDLDTDHQQGMVFEVTSGRCQVQLNGRRVDCSLRGSLEMQETGFTNILAVGDQVLISEFEDGTGAVEQVLPRRSMLARQDTSFQGRASGRRHIIAANVDRLLVVASWRKPSIWPELIDRYLIAAVRNELEAVICVNKTDLVEDEREVEETLQPYRALGYQILLTSATSGAGIPGLRDLLDGKITVLAGLSGVGKSSLLSAVQPNLNLRALEIGKRGKNRDQGRHTTTTSTLYPLENGGGVIDTPGIREFGLAGLTKRELGSFYPEIENLRAGCQFSDCLHLEEPQCGVHAGVAQGQISPMRYENYTKILDCLPA